MSTSLPELRLFISSTFHDLQQERDYLMKRIFPEIRVICREHGVELTEIDLRWGLTDEQNMLGEVISTCLEEIDRCRPYFIGILGSRYGWVPEFHVIQKNADLLRRYPWIEDAVADGTSIVELEFLYGALMRHSETDGTFFYLRASGDESENDDETSRLTRLAQMVRMSGYPVHEFDSPTMLGEQVRNDLVSIINQRWPIEEQPSPVMRERHTHEAFAIERRRAYIVTHEYLRRFNEWIEFQSTSCNDGEEEAASGTRPFIISAPSGAGKSSLIAYLEQSYRRRRSDAFVVAHYVGASTASNTPTGILWHVMAEIKERYHLDDEIPATPDGIIASFPEWLAHLVPDDPLLWMLDGVDQLDPSMHSLGWLPRYLPPTVRLVISTVPGETLDHMRERGWEELRIGELSVEERDALIVRYLGEFHKQLPHRLRHRIASDAKSASPLFLRTLLEELRLFGEFQRLDEIVEHYLMSQDTADLFRCILERMEHDYGEELVRSVMSAIACSRRGLSETELFEVIGGGRAELLRFLHALDSHLVRRNGLLDFFHSFLRDAVEFRYVNSSESRTAVRRMIAGYFDAMARSDESGAPASSSLPEPVSFRVASELPWQWNQIEAWKDLLNSVTSAPCFLRLADDDLQYELMYYWRVLDEQGYDVDDAYRQEVSRLEQMEIDQASLAGFCQRVGEVLVLATHYDAAEEFLGRSLALREAVSGVDDPITAESIASLGELYLTRGEYHKAEPLLRRAVETIQRLTGGDSLATANSLDKLATLLYQRKALDEAEAIFKRVLEIRERQLGSEHRETARTVGTLGAVYYAKQDYDRAEEHFRRALNVAERVLGTEHLITAESINNVATVLKAKGDLAEAALFMNNAIAINERLLGPEHPVIATMLSNRATVLMRMHRFAEAEETLHRAIAIDTRVFGKEHPITAMKLINLQELLRQQGKLVEAEEILHTVIQIRSQAFGSEHIETARTNLMLATLLVEMGSYDAALQLYRRFYPVKEEHLGRQHPSTARSRRYYRELLELLGLLEEAVSLTNTDT